MKIESLTPMIRTRDLDQTVDFYKNVLGFTVYELNHQWGWASVGLDGAGLMIAVPNEHTPFAEPIFTGSFYFRVPDADEWFSKLKDSAKLCYPIDSFGYGMREFAIYDNNGYLLQFGHEIMDKPE